MAAAEVGRLMRVLITGAGGQLGHDLVRTCAEAGDEVVACGRAELDLADRDSVYQAITGTRPDVVLHAGAWTAVDACEGDPERAFQVNALGTEWVADAARRVGAHLVAVSAPTTCSTAPRPSRTTSGTDRTRSRSTAAPSWR